MTMIHEVDIKCSACGQTSSHPVLFSTNSWGSPDLDLRPAGMQRDTMNTWVQECPHCGYVAPSLRDECEIPAEFLKSEKYTKSEGFEFKGKLADMFYKSYLINKELGRPYECFGNLRCCAWDCDDRNDVENARKIRILAIPYIDEIIEKENERKEDFIVMKADILRRAGEFSKLIEEYGGLTLGDEVLDRLITFQVIKAREEDDGRYTLGDLQ